METVNIPNSYAQKSITRKLCRAVLAYFDDEKHREEFKEWHLKTYGEPYEFKTKVVKK